MTRLVIQGELLSVESNGRRFDEENHDDNVSVGDDMF